MRNLILQITYKCQKMPFQNIQRIIITCGEKKIVKTGVSVIEMYVI